MIAVWWIGESDPDEPLLEEIRVHAAREFEIEAVIHRGYERPSGTYDIKRRQHSSREVLRWLVDRCPAGALAHRCRRKPPGQGSCPDQRR